MRILYAVLLCLACSSAPRQYMDGAPMRPPAPIVVEPRATPPGTGLPEYWAPPAERKPDVQPNPRPRRYLPPSREPGIWASDERPASDDPIPAIKVLDVEIPMPPDIETRRDAWLATQCAYIMDLGMRTNLTMQAEMARRPKDVRCMAALAFYWCTVQLGARAREELDDWERDGTISASGRRLREKLGPTETTGFAAAARECGLPVPDWTKSLYTVFDQMQHGRTPSVKQ